MYRAVAGGRPPLFILHPGIRVLLPAGEMQLLQCVPVPLTEKQHSFISTFPCTALCGHQHQQQTGTVDVRGKYLYLHNQTSMCVQNVPGGKHTFSRQGKTLSVFVLFSHFEQVSTLKRTHPLVCPFTGFVSVTKIRG